MKKILLLLPVLASLGACQVTTPEPGSSSREVEIRLSTAKGLTRADETDETIKTVDILVFDSKDKDPEDAVFLYSRYAWLKSGDVYNAVLKVGEELDVYFAINARETITAADLKAEDNLSWSDVREKLLLTNTAADPVALADGLPMWGYRHNITLQDGVMNRFGTVKLLRAIASTDVKISDDNFTLHAGHIVFASTQGYLPFTVDAANMDFGEHVGVDLENPQVDFKLKSPEIPTGTTTTVDFRYEVPVDAAEPDEIKNVLYFFENEGPVGTNGKRNTKLIVEGVWDNPATTEVETAVTYYPLSFRDKSAEEGENDRLTVIRNRKFSISITKVNGAGYPTLDEAKEGEDMNLSYEVIPWDDWTDGAMVSGSEYIFLANDRNYGLQKTALLYRNATSTDVISFTTNIPLANFDLKLTNGGVVVEPDRVANECYAIRVVQDSVDADGRISGHFEFTAKKDYVNAETNPVAMLTVNAGQIEFQIHVSQQDASPDDWNGGSGKDVVFP